MPRQSREREKIICCGGHRSQPHLIISRCSSVRRDGAGVVEVSQDYPQDRRPDHRQYRVQTPLQSHRGNTDWLQSDRRG